MKAPEAYAKAVWEHGAALFALAIAAPQKLGQHLTGASATTLQIKQLAQIAAALGAMQLALVPAVLVKHGMVLPAYAAIQQLKQNV